jgi:hypothetical protein
MQTIQEKTIGEIVRKAEQDYTTGTTTISKYVDWSMSENLNKIDAYLNSKHISGSEDSQGREKPFFNIVTAAVNIWFRATDIDRKNIRIKPTKSKDIMGAFVASVFLQEWMRRENFGSFLNDWGRTLARYGSAVVKFVEQDGKLHSMVVPWSRIIVDSIDFENNIKIELLEFTEAQLRMNENYDQDLVDKLCEAKSARENGSRFKKDNKNDYIKLYEVHGLLPLSYLTGKDKDQDVYVQQMHVISFLATKERGKYDDYTLVSGKEEKDPYMITHLIKEDGRTQSIGAVEHLFEAQWMQNHTVKSIKDQLDLASKLIFQTSDGNYVGQNALSSIENGDIMVHALNQPLTQLSNTSHDITSLQNFGTMWKSLGNEITGISESMLGINPPSGTAWRQTESLLQESHSLFELMTENKGLHIEDMLTTYIIPHIKKTKLSNAKEISGVLEAHNINKVDRAFVKAESAKEAKKQMVDMGIAFLEGKGQAPTPELQAMVQGQIAGDMQGQLDDMGNERYFVPSEDKNVNWKDVFKDLEWEVECDITGEASDKQAVLATLNTAFSTLAQLNGQPLSPEAKLVFNKILTETGVISPIELPHEQQMQPQAVGGGLPA